MKERLRRKKDHNLLVLVFLSALFIVLGQGKLYSIVKENLDLQKISYSDDFRKLPLSKSMVEYLWSHHNKTGQDVGLYLLESSYGKKDHRIRFRSDYFEQLENRWKKADGWIEYEKICESLWEDLRYFPIPESVNDSSATVSYCDSWLYERNYRSEGIHEGTDIMADKNVRGYYPVLSMTDGVITNLGWLELGGYRVGITAPKGAYYYYAHLSSYANLKEGMKIKAGDLLGFMGDSGYGKEEGTVGKFPVHLHVGIYLYPDGKEVSYNPYAILRYLEKYKMKCNYK